MGPPRRAARRAGQLRRWPAWALYLVGGAAVIVAHYLVPAVSLLPAWTPRLVLYQGLSFSAAVAILAGVQLHRPSRRRPWYLLAVSQFVYASADAAFYVAHDVLHQQQFPALADLLYLSHYPILMAGLLLLVRQRTPKEDRASLIDAAVIALSAGLLSWLFLIGPLALGGDAQLAILGRMASVAYPVADLLVFAVAVRLLVGPGSRPVSYWLLSASLLVVLATDTVYVLMQLTGTYTTGNVLDASWLGSYVLLGAAALHPSMRGLADRGIGFCSLQEQVDTTTPGGKLVFHVFAALAEFERDLVRERTSAGLAAARARGHRGGRPSVLTAHKLQVAREMHASGQYTVAAIAEALGVSRASV
jgi:two-component system, cell cycle response regulator